MHHADVTAAISGPARTAAHLGLATEALRVQLAPDQHTEIETWFRHARYR